MPKSYLRRLSLPLSLLFVVCSLLAGLSWIPAPSRAQENIPTPTRPLISAIVRAGGATLWQASNGEPVSVATPGERLDATARSTDDNWLFVSNRDGDTGWVARDAVLVFNLEVLPQQRVTIHPAQPTSTPEPALSTNLSATLSATVTSTLSAARIVVTATAGVAASGATTVALTIQAERLNVRAGPGTGYPVIAKAQAGEVWHATARTATGDWLQVDRADGDGWLAAAYVSAEGDLSTLPVAAGSTAIAAASQTGSTAPPAAVQPAPPPARPAGGELRGQLVLQVEAGGAIYLYDLATGSLHHLTGGFDPTISPDGAQVAFTRTGGEQGLYVINVDGSGERLVFGERNGLYMPKWSPNGNSLLFVRSDSSWKCKDYSERVGRYQCLHDRPGDGDLPYMREIRPRLARVDLDGENYLDIASLDTASAPDWVNAGIVYASDGGIQITSDNGKDENRLVYFNVQQQYYQDPDWQPRPNGGSGRIVLQQRRGSHWEIFGVNPDGSGYTALTRPATVLVDALPSNVAPAWSPDGEYIVFLSNRTAENSAGDWGVWVMRADGSDQRRLPIDLPFNYTYVEEQMIDWGP